MTEMAENSSAVGSGTPSGVTSPKSEDQASHEATIGELNKENTGLKTKLGTVQNQLTAIKSQNEALSLKN